MSMRALSRQGPIVGPVSREKRLTLEPLPGFILMGMADTGKSLRSGELAQLTGVSPDTIRHYERIGILRTPPRTPAGYRMYSRDTIDRVRLVQRALQLGFTLTELSEILRTRDNGNAPCHRVLNLTEEKLRSLGQQIQEFQRTQSYMRQLVRDWRRTLSRTPPGDKAMLLLSLADKPTLRTESRKRSAKNNLTRRPG
jgi:DNA-binding transcriptional MerR regulator